jgi:hypothetical protein
MKRILSILMLILPMLGMGQKANPDTVYFEDKQKVTFSLMSNDPDAYKIIEVNYKTANPDISKEWIRYIGSTTVRKIGYFGTIQVRQDGVGYFVSNSNTPDTCMFRYTISNWRSGTDWTTVTIIRKKDLPPPPVVVEPSPEPAPVESPSNTKGPSYTSQSYNWGRTIGNSSKYQYGPKLIKALRSPTGIAEMDSALYMTTGLVEGNSGIMSVKNQIKKEILPPLHGDVGLNMEYMVSDGKRLYIAGFDSYSGDSNTSTRYRSHLNAAVIAVEKDNEYVFKYGTPFHCTWQDNNYKSGIHLRKDNITGLDVDETTLYVYCGTKCYEYDKITGQYKGVVNVPTPTYIAKAVKGSNVLEMTETKVTLNGKVICTTPTSPTVSVYNFIPKDFNDYSTKGSVCFGDNCIWVTDAGNCRVLKYDMQGRYISQIAYLPMNYNCSVDRNNPTRVFAKELEYKVSYPDMTWELVANWNYNLGTEYQPIGKNLVRDFLRDVCTVNGETFAFVEYHDLAREERSPTLMKFTPNGLVPVKRFLAWANVSMTTDGKIVLFEREGTKANFYLDGVLKESVTIPSNSALKGAGKVGYTSDGSFVVYDFENSRKGYHLSWVKGGQVKNAMPYKSISDDSYPYGDFYCVTPRLQYGGGTRVYVLGNKVFVNYLGEFYGASDGGQTNLWFMYENGVFVKRVGMTVFESNAMDGKDSPRVAAGNSYGGGVVYMEGKIYIITNCEHTSALQWFQIN